MVTLALIHHPLNKVAADVTQTDLSTESSAHGESVTTAETNIDNTVKLDALANEQPRALLSDRPYAFIVK